MVMVVMQVMVLVMLMIMIVNLSNERKQHQVQFGIFLKKDDFFLCIKDNSINKPTNLPVPL